MPQIPLLGLGNCIRSRAHLFCSIQPRIDVTRAGNFKGAEAIERSERGDDLLRDDLGSLAQLAGQFICNRRGQFAKLKLRRNLQRNGCQFQIVLRLQNFAEMLLESLLQVQNHVGMPRKSLIFLGDSNRNPVTGGLGFVVSHPFRKVLGMDGAPSFLFFLKIAD